MMTFPNPFNVFPGAGGNWQEIMTRWWSPNISLNFAGDAGIEREVNEDVASYGRQIGWLNEIVEALAIAAPDAVKAKPAADALAKLKTAQQKIAEIKARRKANAVEKARAALGALTDDDYRRLLRSLDPEHPPGAG
jgi:hypothetical protein